jgi:CubicO group peptidase (beta-lactamase class C family)
MGMIVERVSGKRYGSYLAERILQPAHLTSTRTHISRAIVKNRASGYNLVEGSLINAQYASPTNLWSSGGLLSTAVDLMGRRYAPGRDFENGNRRGNGDCRHS